MDATLIDALINGVSGGTVIILIIFGFLIPKPAYTRITTENARKDKVIAKLQEALDLERQRSNAATQAGLVTNQLLSAITTLATESRAADKQEHADIQADTRRYTAPLTGKDAGP